MSGALALSLLQSSNDDAAGALACAGCGGIMLVAALVPLAIQIALLVWVARDAKARGMDGAVLWMLFVFFVPVIGVIVYVLSRPQGTLVPCPHCQNKRLQASAICPHCGH